MNTLPTTPETPDELDRLFSDFFKGQLKRPWPGAPTTSAAAQAEPSELAAARAADAPRNLPSSAPQAKGRNGAVRARFTLAASVALLLGTCWALSNGFQPGTRPTLAPGTPTERRMLKESGAHDKGILPEIQKNKANDNGGLKIDAGKFE